MEQGDKAVQGQDTGFKPNEVQECPRCNSQFFYLTSASNIQFVFPSKIKDENVCSRCLQEENKPVSK